MESDFLASEGWELIVQGLGKHKEDGATFDSFYFPYLVLYNRFNSTLRLMYMLPGDVDVLQFNSMEVVLKYDKLPNSQTVNITGMLEHHDGISNPLDTKTDIQKITAPTSAIHRGWTQADFTMAYDACTCKFPSSLSFIIKGISEADVEITGRAYGTITNLFDGNTYDAKDRLMNVLKNGPDAEIGLETFKSIEKYQQYYGLRSRNCPFR